MRRETFRVDVAPGPGKRDGELREAIGTGVGEIVIESVREAQRANAIAGALGVRQPVLVRIAPARVPTGFGDQMAGRPCPFGIDEERLHDELPAVLALPNLRVIGMHAYSGTQCLKAEAIRENYRLFIDIFRTTAQAFDLRPEKLVFGSGLGIPYHEGDRPLDLETLARDVVADLDALRREPRFAEARPVLELGRYLVGEAGYFVTRVLGIKRSRGRRIAICDGGLNAHLAASGNFGMVIKRNYVMHKVGGDGPLEEVDLVGPLCTSLDRLGTGVLLPRLEEGDLVAVHNSGAYGPTASPVHFISHRPPDEILIEDAGLARAGPRVAAA